ncbi:type IV secretory system conjugative DNA transfer family protein [Maribacter polysaccharolyticus]|uniref:type IV secretory system conjugative DNA transfer family protein n=1 Tax=Maribacter polysaccharolyticus TaxID=3020831 RepID=UPI00237F190B|nr:type IV secretory system conjugative DNA transfer family protein [Maribacter polysaccharolyticus]MDE3744033.1 type IV secretory system conjugative DNA transfer family protein [Maribacter polysaccharolyticus]
MEDNKGLYKLFALLQGAVYFSILLEIIMFQLFNHPLFGPLNMVFHKMGNLSIYNHIAYSKLFTLGLLVITTIGTKPRKKVDIKTGRYIVVPVLLGLAITLGATFAYIWDPSQGAEPFNVWGIAYMIGSLLGIIVLHVGFDNLSKIINFKLGGDKFNDENESFKQNKVLMSNQYSMNLPMEYYFKGKHRKGWFNLTNPFRGTIVIGTPESGKSYSIIMPFIRQTLAKNFTALVYDYKYPDLTEISYYHYLKNKKKNNGIKNLSFHVVNLDKVEYSRRVNPLMPKYIDSLAAAIETAGALVNSLQKRSEASEGGAQQFFSQSAINFLSATLFFFSKHEEGKYSTLPHVLSFLNKEYDEIFDVLMSEPELESLLAPFISAHKTKTYQQLEGQLGTLRIHLGKLNTKEAAWVFSSNDVDLQISNHGTPSVFVIANSPKTEATNSTINSLLLNTLTKQINTKGNLPCAVIIDELPTIFFYKIQNLIATARSNKVAVMLGFQELPQLVEGYGKQIADTITSVVGNVVSGGVKNKDTLMWLERLFGKSRQLAKGISISRKETTTSIREQMDNLIPSSKIADLRTGEVVAKLAFGFNTASKTNENPNTYRCKILIDPKEVAKEESSYRELPKYYDFENESTKNSILMKNMLNIRHEVDYIVQQYTTTTHADR